VLEDGEGITAHGGVTPVRYRTAQGTFSAFQVIDWAGARRAAGAGLLLFRGLWPYAELHLAIGGSSDAVRVLTRIPGLKRQAPMKLFAAPLRPFGQWTRSQRDWRGPARWIRAWKWKLSRPVVNLCAWKAIPLERLEPEHASLLQPHTHGEYTPLERTPELVNYWLACPGGRVRAWRLDYGGKPAGIVVIAFLRGVARIVDLTLADGGTPLAEAYALTLRLASTDRQVCEVIAASSAPPVVRALEAAGFIARGESLVMAGDPLQRLSSVPPIEVNLTIGDGYYLQAKTNYFHTFG
jgi:hypothetical protein